MSEAAGRPIEWTTRTLTQGEILQAFASHCRDELTDVEVLDAGPARLVARWRRETSRIELCEAIEARTLPAGEEPTMLIGDYERAVDELVDAFVADAALRGRLALLDLARLEKVNAVRSSVFVYFEWFLRDAYGVKVLPSARFTQKLIDRGVISLGFG